MELEQANKKEVEKPKQNNNTPIIETFFSTSKDGKYFITKTTITTIKPINYIRKVIE